MATDLENIIAIKSNTLTALASLAADAAAGNHKLTHTAEGRTYNWTEYQTYLENRLKWCNEQLAAEDPYEVETFIL